MAYGNQKGIGIILWASWRNLTGGGDISPAVEQVISHYAQMGIKGFKIDFFDRDDQLAISLPNNSQHVPPSITCCLTYTD